MADIHPADPHPAYRTPLIKAPAGDVSQGVTLRQMECLFWVQQGKSASDIGGILGISGRTVEGHLAKLCGHFGVKTRFQAVLKARDLGLLAASAP